MQCANQYLIQISWATSVTTKASANVIASLAITHDNTFDIWHKRLGHVNKKRLHQIQIMSIGIETFDDKEISLCTPCIQSKQHKKKFPKE